MYCPKCGSKVPDGSKFCENCGAKMPERVQTQSVLQPAQQSVIQPTQPQAQLVQPQIQQMQPTGQQMPSSQNRAPKKTFNKTILIVVAAIIVVIIAAVMFMNRENYPPEYDEQFGVAENIGDVTDEGYELVWKDGKRKIFFDPVSTNFYDLDGEVNTSELFDLGVLRDQEVTINFTSDVTYMWADPLQVTVYAENRTNTPEYRWEVVDTFDLNDSNKTEHTTTFELHGYGFRVEAIVIGNTYGAYYAEAYMDDEVFTYHFGYDSNSRSKSEAEYDVVIRSGKREGAIESPNELPQSVKDWVKENM